jgi:hypothetical protein
LIGATHEGQTRPRTLRDAPRAWPPDRTFSRRQDRCRQPRA